MSHSNTPLSEQSNDSKDRKYTLTGGKLAPTPTDTNTSFKEELEQILERFMYSYTHLDDPYDLKQALTSIINLVDKEVIGKNQLKDDFNEFKNSAYHKDALRAEQRAIIRGSDEKDM